MRWALRPNDAFASIAVPDLCVEVVAIAPSDPRAVTTQFILQNDCAFAHLKLRRPVGARGALRIFDLVLRMVCWWRNTKALHLVKQRGALQAKSGSCSSRTSELPISALASSQNFSTYLVFQGGV